MRTFKLTLEYDGTFFSGWQTQAPGLRTIQNHLETQLAKIFKTKINCQASGRTDQGVHALGQVAHFKVDTTLEVALIHKALNSFLDKDLSVLRVEEVALNFHAQKDVISKTYRYTILNRTCPSALWRNRAYFHPENLNVPAMQLGAAYLVGKHDFKCFQSASTRSKIKNTVRTIKRLTVNKQGYFINLTITADGFLYKMVRNITGALLAVGQSRLKPEEILDILTSKRRIYNLRTAPSYGLCLVKVQYKNTSKRRQENGN